MPHNALAEAASSYLRSAMHQPIAWHQWGEQAFAKAKAEDKPILLDIGAVWCHWCHVMDRESYEDATLADLINREYIAIKVDRDERPDVDTRYQAAVQAISGQGGWPLTAFLTPEGHPFFGGTYFPPTERMGRPSFRRVLETMAAAFREKREDVNDSAGSVMQAIEYNEAFAGGATDLQNSSAGIALIDKLVASTLQSYDPRQGGFGSQPKFPHPGALDMLIDSASRSGPNHAKAAEAAQGTLHGMFRGGVYDQLAGGFHRYSVDERWVVPHFEKMSYDNSELLRSYVHGFQTFVEPEFARAAIDVMRWMDEWLSDREQGGFYASQDADISLDDDGDYFTWSRAEAEAVLTPEEFAIAGPYFDIGTVGDMHHDPSRNVLFRPLELAAVAQQGGVSAKEAEALLAAAKHKMYAARLQRPTPFIDKTLYTGWNAMAIRAYLEAGRALQRPAATDFALKSLRRVLDVAWRDGRVGHVVAWGDTTAPSAPAPNVPGTLDDFVFLADACLTAFQVTGDATYFHTAQAIADSLIARFSDHEKGGFFDTETSTAPALGALSARRKPLQDAPTPAGNPAAAAMLLRLAALTGNEDYQRRAEATLECFAGIVEHFGLYAATFGLALGLLARPAVQVVLIEAEQGTAAATGLEVNALARRNLATELEANASARRDLATELEAIALARYAVNKSVFRIRRDQLGNLPPALAETLPNLDGALGTVALVCAGNTCQSPAQTAAELIAALHAIA
ncbi:thioredoxin domain-containing protein [Terriglobus sp.]|uniref:thioredoxin domain-containing protein n=1 Tax=Terriglobus sp. TaxID=1889013 RepID=UPI003AFFA5A1